MKRFDSTRFFIAALAIVCLVVAAILKHFLPGISEVALGSAAGVATAFITGQSLRPSSMPPPEDK